MYDTLNIFEYSSDPFAAVGIDCDNLDDNIMDARQTSKWYLSVNKPVKQQKPSD